MRKRVHLTAAFALALALAPALALSFHDGGVGACEGCHTMHAKPTGERIGASLLHGSDPSSTCLACHGGSSPGGYQVLTAFASGTMPPGNFTPGGDFAWLLRSYSWTGPQGKLETSPGSTHGHSVVAADALLEADFARPTAPGGSYPSDRLSCISCHDPHGRYRLDANGTIRKDGAPIVASGSYGGPRLAQPSPTGAVGTYRLLGGVGYAPKSVGPVVPFSSNPPVALAPQEYNRSERSADVRVAYGAGMSEWCRNCHGYIHDPGPSPDPKVFRHPAGREARLNAGGELAIYNNYVRSGVLTGMQATSYTSLVPYEEGTTDRITLAQRAVSDGSVLSGPYTGQENVMCLSCHRAHATAWDHALRWNNPPSGYIVVGGSWPGIDAPGRARLDEFAQGRTRAETEAAMYGRDAANYGEYQKVLCNKCHGQG
jgi:hypothetical protein